MFTQFFFRTLKPPTLTPSAVLNASKKSFSSAHQLLGSKPIPGPTHNMTEMNFSGPPYLTPASDCTTYVRFKPVDQLPKRRYRCANGFEADSEADEETVHCANLPKPSPSFTPSFTTFVPFKPGSECPEQKLTCERFESDLEALSVIANSQLSLKPRLDELIRNIKRKLYQIDLQKAENHLKGFHFREAEALLDKLIVQLKDDIKTSGYLGYFKSALVDAYAHLAQALLDFKESETDEQKAIQCLEKVHELNPAHPLAAEMQKLKKKNNGPSSFQPRGTGPRG